MTYAIGSATAVAHSPFNLDDAITYASWREWKLANYPQSIQNLMVELRDPQHLSQGEREAITASCCRSNMAIYQCRDLQYGEITHKTLVWELGRQLGLQHLDHNLYADEEDISALQVHKEGPQRGYIPYTNRPLNWHTDGYYNPPNQKIRAMVLHCANAAAEGGKNALLDHEIAYILMRDEDPEYIVALMQPDAMTIPANTEGESQIRPAQTGPVFSVDALSGDLHMRYTARKRNISWKQEPKTLAAVRFLEERLAEDSPYILRYQLQPGQGIVANNVLHNRSGFSDDPTHGRTRLIYRARYYDRVADTGIDRFYRPGD